MESWRRRARHGRCLTLASLQTYVCVVWHAQAAAGAGVWEGTITAEHHNGCSINEEIRFCPNSMRPVHGRHAATDQWRVPGGTRRGDSVFKQVSLWGVACFLRLPHGFHRSWHFMINGGAGACRLRLELLLLSAAARRSCLTLVVPLSAGRLHLLEGMCTSWGGPLSAAVYVARTPEPPYTGVPPAVNAAKHAMRELFDRCGRRHAAGRASAISVLLSHPRTQGCVRCTYNSCRIAARGRSQRAAS